MKYKSWSRYKFWESFNIGQRSSFREASSIVKYYPITKNSSVDLELKLGIELNEKFMVNLGLYNNFNYQDLDIKPYSNKLVSVINRFDINKEIKDYYTKGIDLYLNPRKAYAENVIKIQLGLTYTISKANSISLEFFVDPIKNCKNNAVILSFNKHF